MQLFICENKQQLGERAAGILATQIQKKPDSVLGLATGSSPVETYRCLVGMCRAGTLSFRDVVTYNLDEYVGLDAAHEQSYAYFMRTHLFEHVDIDPANIHIPNGTAPDAHAECTRYTEALAGVEGGLDIQLLGVGLNGHIGFNEPDDVFTPDTHVVTLDDSTIEANARFFASPDDVPRYAITMGVRPIMYAKQVLVLLSGAAKAPILRDALRGPVTPEVPASLLQLHPRVTLVVDREAASLL